MVYIREAHPEDGWQVPQNERQGIKIKQPTTEKERTDVAHKACTLLKISLPTLVDGMDDKVNQAYAAWPDRLYIVDKDGKIALMGDPGPRGFKPSVDASQSWLEKLARGNGAKAN